jgi:hypothetical protein
MRVIHIRINTHTDVNWTKLQLWDDNPALPFLTRTQGEGFESSPISAKGSDVPNGRDREPGRIVADA